MRRFDHVVLCVADLGAARADFAALGFTLTPPARHPFGTANTLIQFTDRTFIELLAIVDPAAFPRPTAGHFGFASFNQAFMERHGEGMSMLVFATDDARADVDDFTAAGLQTYAPFDFERDATLPDGATARVRFSLAFVTHPDMPDAAFFTCQQRHAPEAFWRPEYQAHANGAEGLAEIVMEAQRPRDWTGFLAALTGAAPRADGPELVLGPPRNRLLVRHAPDAGAPRFCAVRLAGPTAPPARLHGLTLQLGADQPFNNPPTVGMPSGPGKM